MLVTVAPGANMALVTGQILVGGTGLGPADHLRQPEWAGGSRVLAAGLSALLASAAAYTAVKVAGAG